MRPIRPGRETRRDVYQPQIEVATVSARIQREIKRRAASERLSRTDGSLAGDHPQGLRPFSDPLARSDDTERELRLQQPLEARSDDEYHVNDLLRFHDGLFVQSAYRAILKRYPDSLGFVHFLEKLRSGSLSKVEILARLRYSREGRARGVRLHGLMLPAAIQWLGRLPVLGYFVRWIVGLLRLPLHLGNQRQFEAYSLALHQQVADYVNESHRRLDHRVNELVQLLDELSEVRAVQVANGERIEALSSQHGAFLSALRESREGVRAEIERSKEEFGALLDSVQSGQERRSGVLANGERELEAFYLSFEEEFRGAQEEIVKRLRVYLPVIAEASAGTLEAPILDIGCGRGEWLELLRDSGYSAKGVDLNRLMVEECRRRELDAEQGEAIAYLEGLTEGSLGAVTGFHLIEHLPFEALIELLDETVRVLKPGGVAIFETPNPRNVLVGSQTFYMDPTHRKPLPCEMMKFTAEQRGLCRVSVQELNPSEIPEIPEGSDVARRFNAYFYGPKDYALIGWKPGA